MLAFSELNDNNLAINRDGSTIGFLQWGDGEPRFVAKAPDGNWSQLNSISFQEIGECIAEMRRRRIPFTMNITI